MIDIEICWHNDACKSDEIKSRIIELLKTLAIKEPLWISMNERYTITTDYQRQPHLRVFYTDDDTVDTLTTHKKVVAKLRGIGLPIQIIQLSGFVPCQEESVPDNPGDQLLKDYLGS